MASTIAGDAVMVSSALAAALMLFSPTRAACAPKSFDCRLTVVETKASGKKDVGSEQRSIVLLIDEQAKAVTVQQDSGARALDNVTMSEHNINGYVDDLSLSVDLSAGKSPSKHTSPPPIGRASSLGTAHRQSNRRPDSLAPHS